MTNSAIGTMMRDLMKVAQSGDAKACHEPMSGIVRQVSGFRCLARFGDLEMTVDEPVSFGGTGLAPNPAEVALAGLAASIQVTLLAYAEFLGADVRDVTIEVSGALDARGFFGTDPSISASFSSVSVDITFHGENDEAVVSELLRRVETCCPMLAAFRQPVEVNLSLKRRH